MPPPTSPTFQEVEENPGQFADLDPSVRCCVFVNQHIEFNWHHSAPNRHRSNHATPQVSNFYSSHHKAAHPVSLTGRGIPQLDPCVGPPKSAQRSLETSESSKRARFPPPKQWDQAIARAQERSGRAGWTDIGPSTTSLLLPLVPARDYYTRLVEVNPSSWC
ncbi:hypothetical protein V2G26_015221 [Clonostachys chloroleuca]